MYLNILSAFTTQIQSNSSYFVKTKTSLARKINNTKRVIFRFNSWKFYPSKIFFAQTRIVTLVRNFHGIQQLESTFVKIKMVSWEWRDPRWWRKSSLPQEGQSGPPRWWRQILTFSRGPVGSQCWWRKPPTSPRGPFGRPRCWQNILNSSCWEPPLVTKNPHFLRRHEARSSET